MTARLAGEISMKMNKIGAALAALAATSFAAPAFAAEPLALECEWSKLLLTKSSFDSTKKENKPEKILLIFDFDASTVQMDNVEGRPSDLQATTTAISFCVDSCQKIGPYERKSDDGVINATMENQRVQINRMTGGISWAQVEEQYQGKIPYKTVTVKYVGECGRTEIAKPKF
jgi:hypothetical protein